MTAKPTVRSYLVPGKPASREEAERLFFDDMAKHPGKRKGDPRTYIKVVEYVPWTPKTAGAISWVFDEEAGKAAEAVPEASTEPRQSPGPAKVGAPSAPAPKLMVPLSAIVITGENPRTAMDAEELESLKESIKAIGQKEPVKVRLLEGGRYELISGHRRVRALTELGGAEAWAVIDEVDAKRRKLEMLVVNLNREDLNPVDIALALRDTLEKVPGMTEAELGKACGHKQAWVSNHLRLLKAPKQLQDRLISREITPRHVQLVLPFDGFDVLKDILKEWGRKGWDITVAELDDLVRDGVRRSNSVMCLKRLPYGMEEIEPYLEMDGCRQCIGTKAVELEDWNGAKQPYCLDAKCWKRKVADAKRALSKARAERAKAKGGTSADIIDKDRYQVQYLSSAPFDVKECLTCDSRKRMASSLAPVCEDRDCAYKKQMDWESKQRRLGGEIDDARRRALEIVVDGIGKDPKRLDAAKAIALRALAWRFRFYGHDCAEALRPWIKGEDLGRDPDCRKVLERIEAAGKVDAALARIAFFACCTTGENQGLTSSLLFDLKVLEEDPAAELVKKREQMASDKRASARELGRILKGGASKPETKAQVKEVPSKKSTRSKASGDEHPTFKLAQVADATGAVDDPSASDDEEDDDPEDGADEDGFEEES